MSGAARDARFRPRRRRADRAQLILRDGRLVDDSAGRELAARRIARRYRARPLTMFFRDGVDGLPQGRHDRSPQPRDAGDDAVLRPVGGPRVRVRARQRRAASSPTRRRASCGLRSPSAGTLALGRTFERERYTDTLRALLLAPAPRAGDLRRQAPGHARRALRSSSCCWCRWWRCCSMRRCCSARCTLIGAARDRHDRLCRGRDAVRRDAGARPQPRRAAADPVVSDDDSGHHCGSARHRRAAQPMPDEPMAPSG